MTEEKNEEVAMNTIERYWCELRGWEMERLQLFIFASIDKNGHILLLANEKIYDKIFRFYRLHMAQLTFINIKVFS
jgi:hypothetical protein